MNESLKLAPEAIAWFTAKPENMDLYLRFGSGACGKTRQECEANLKSSPTDWLSFKPVEEVNPFFKEWNLTHHMGYFWHGVCLWRSQNGIDLTMPQMDRLAGAIRSVLNAMTPWQSHLYIFNAISYFDLAQFRIGKVGEGMILNESTLDHSLIRAEIQHIDSHGNKWIEAEFELMNEMKKKKLKNEGEFAHV